MKTALYALASVAVLTAATGCVVAPGRPGYVQGSATVYVAPAYESPGPGWAWEQHPREGWGWHHRDRGWHKGWQ